MSLQFSHNPMTKREMQDTFRRALDDQRRLKQDLSSQSKDNRIQGTENGRVSEVIPEIDRQQVPIRDIGLEGAVAVGKSDHQKKRLYMSALSEMNGRPLHVRQQQFEKESQYRKLLQDQIEENRRRKEVERAKVEEERKKELEEMRQLQGMPGPRKQQHAEFQQSPDHPLPSPGGPFIVREQHSPLTPNENCRSQVTYGYGGPPRSQSGLRGARAFCGACDGILEGQSEQRRTSPSQVGVEDEQVHHGERHRGPKLPLADFAGAGAEEIGSFQPSTAEPFLENYVDEAGRCESSECSGLVQLSHASRTRSKLLSEMDMVPRSDFDELTKLCRELLLEQKNLRQKLGEVEERNRFIEHLQQQQSEQAHVRRKSLSVVKRSKDHVAQHVRGTNVRDQQGRRRSLPLQGKATLSQREGQVGAALRRDPRAKPNVAFGSTVPRMERRRQVDMPLSGRDLSSQVTRGTGRNIRTSASEPKPRSRGSSLRHQLPVTSSHDGGENDCGDRSSNSTRRMAEVEDVLAKSRLISQRDRLPAHWQNEDDMLSTLDEERLGVEENGVIFSPSGNRGGVSSHDSISGRRESPRGVNGGDGLGGESTFLGGRALPSRVEEHILEGGDKIRSDLRFLTDRSSSQR